MYYYDNKRGILINKDNNNVRIKVYPPSNGTFRLKDYPYSFISSKEVINNSEDKEDLVFYDRLIGDGVAYIDTQIGCAVDETIKVKFRNLKWQGAIFNGIGSGHTSQQRYRIAAHNASTAILLVYNGSNNYSSVNCWNTANKDNIVTMTHDKVVVTDIDGVVKDSTERVRNDAAVPSIKPILIYAKAELAYYSIIASNGSTLVNYIPCTYNGEAGMYDIVNKVFYGNANTEGSFSVAND